MFQAGKQKQKTNRTRQTNVADPVTSAGKQTKNESNNNTSQNKRCSFAMGRKRPATVKVEPVSPNLKKKAKVPKPEKVEETPKEPEMAPKASDGLQSVAEPGQESQNSQASEPGGKKPVKAGKLPPPGKEVWKDVHILSKEGKPALRNAWEKANQAGSQQAKREFYYNVFLLDPNVSQKAVHKESLERLQENETTTKGWMTDPLDPDFKQLCKAACEGLKERPHEVEKWAAKGMKQYYVEKELNTEETRAKESSTKALQCVDGLEAEDFHQVEKALSVNSLKKQFLLGSKKPVKAVEEPEKAAEEEETEGALGSAVGRWRPSSQRWLQMHSWKVAFPS